jgi:hypothetical protein
LSGITPEKIATAKAMGMGKSYIPAFAGSLVISYVRARLLVFVSVYIKMSGIPAGLRPGSGTG